MLVTSLSGISILTLEFRLPNLAQTRHRVRKLNAVANKLNSALTLARPHSRNLLTFIWSLRIPKIGSIICLRRAYRVRASSVFIHWRCLCKSSSAELIQSTRPDITDRVIRRELEQEDALTGDPGYTVVGGEEPEALAEQPIEDDFDEDSES